MLLSSAPVLPASSPPWKMCIRDSYKNVRNLNFEEFIRYFPDSGQATEAEFEALKKLDDWPFKRVARMEDCLLYTSFGLSEHLTSDFPTS